MSATHPAVVSIGDDVLHLDPRDDLGLARGRPYEPLVREMMERYVPRGGTVVDGGAHIGYHTILAARLVGPHGRVIAFEPAPATYALLARNVTGNGYGNVTLVQGALADAPGHGILHLSDVTSGDHRIAQIGSRRTVQIDLFSLDHYLSANESVDFLKLDIQGAEALALNGAREVLERSPKLVAAIEYDPCALPSAAAAEAFVAELFARFETILDVNDETDSVEEASAAELLRRYTRENRRHTNLLCLNR